MKKHSFIFFLSLIFLSQASHSTNGCFDYLELSKNKNLLPRLDVTTPIALVSAKLNLAAPKKSKFISESDHIRQLIQPLNLFRPVLEKFDGGIDLFQIFETGNVNSEIEFINALQNWTNKFIPGYKIMTASDLKNYKFKAKYSVSGVSIFNPETGTLDDNYLFELYNEKIIPIFKITDLMSHLFVLSRPKIRLEFEKLVSLYLRDQDLGDRSDIEQLLPRQRNSRPYENINRLSYISSITHLLISRVSFLATDDMHKKVLVFLGSQNTTHAESILSFNSSSDQSLLEALDLGFSNNSKALTYFLNQAELENPAIKAITSFMQKEKIKPKNKNISTKDNVSDLFETLNNMLQKILLLKSTAALYASRYNLSTQERWIYFSTLFTEDDNDKLLKLISYKFRFSVIEYYIKVVDSDITASENRARREQPGPLFR